MPGLIVKRIYDKLPEFKAGEVWLTGAGPGDIGLLTACAIKGIECADCIVYDALVNLEILELANENTKLLHSGKRGGRPSPDQQDISQILVDLASQGNRVLRLKGGDPFIFGRGGEEALTLMHNDIPFRVIPGITTGIAGPAYAGIPITHRDYNSVVSFVTGHNADNIGTNMVDWQALAKGGGLLVLYMTVTRLDVISKILIEAGRSESEPVALISNATLPQQTIIEKTLGECTAYNQSWKVQTPCLVVIGSNVKLRQQLKQLTDSNVCTG